MADPKLIYDDVALMQRERTELVGRLVNFNIELQGNITKGRSKWIKLEVFKINQRLAEIKAHSKEKQKSFYEVYYNVAEKSLPMHVKVDLRKYSEEVVKRNLHFHEIKPCNIESLKSIEERKEYDRVCKQLTINTNQIISTKSEARKVFQTLNARLTPDEMTRFKVTLDFLINIINS
jgi:hypothetical protein